MASSSKKARTHVDRAVWKYLDPGPGTDFDKDKYVKFEITTADDEFISLPPLPFYMTYLAKQGTNLYTSHNILKNKKGVAQGYPPKLAYFPNTLGASCLFEEVSVTVNGYNLKEISDLKGYQYLWQSLNRYFSTTDERVKMFGEEMAQIIDKDSLRDWSDPSTELLANSKSLEFYTDQSAKTCCFGFDGISLLGPRCFANAKLHNMSLSDWPPVILPPNTTLVIKLDKTPAPGLRIEYPQDTFTYMTSKAEATTIESYDTKINIKALRIVYKSFRLSGPPLERLRNASYAFRHEAVNYQQFSIIANTMYTPLKVLIPEKTKLVFICFVRTWQLYKYAATNKNQMGRFTFPKHLKSVKCSLPGSDFLAFESGFEGLNEPCNHLSPKTYHQSLLDAKIVDCPYNSLFPDEKFSEKNLSYRQAIMLDLSQKNIKPMTPMNVGIVWDTVLGHDPSDPAHDKEIAVVCFTVQDCELYREKKSNTYNSRIV